jgi:sugar lactone lactonase YvrE
VKPAPAAAHLFAFFTRFRGIIFNSRNRFYLPLKEKQTMAKKKKAPLRRRKRAGGRKKNTMRKNRLFAAGLFILALVVIGVFVSRSKTSPAVNYFVKTVQRFTGENQPCGELHTWDLALTSDGRIVLSDQAASRIVYFDKNGKFIREVGQKQAGPPAFKEISGITSDDGGNAYIVDAWGGMVRGFSPNGKPTVQVELKNVYGPRGVAWVPDAFMVADTGTNRLLKISRDGSNVQVWGKKEGGKSIFDNPMAVCVDASGQVYVADAGNRRIQCLDQKGQSVRQYKMEAPPSRVAVDAKNGLIYATSQEGGFTEVFTVSGKDLGKLTESTQKDQPLKGINGIRVNEQGQLVAAWEKEVKILEPVKQ